MNCVTLDGKGAPAAQQELIDRHRAKRWHGLHLANPWKRLHSELARADRQLLGRGQPATANCRKWIPADWQHR